MQTFVCFSTFSFLFSVIDLGYSYSEVALLLHATYRPDESNSIWTAHWVEYNKRNIGVVCCELRLCFIHFN
jgi:hypothetical protein